MRLGGSRTPGDDLRVVYGSQAAANPGSRNLAGISDPVIDMLIEKIGNAKTRDELTIACRVLDRVLRAGRYWVPMWYNDKTLLAYWDDVLAPRHPTEIRHGRAGYLVVRCRESRKDRRHAVMGSWPAPEILTGPELFRRAPALPLFLDEVNGLAAAQKAARLGDASTVPC